MAPSEYAANILKLSGVLLVPTDTNYAFAADPWNVDACGRLYDIKRRDVKKPLTLFVSRPQDLWRYVDMPASQRDLLAMLMDRHWPGPLNFVLPKSAEAPDHPYFKDNSISIVCNCNPALMAVIEAFGRPLAMTSANVSGVEHDGLITCELAMRTFSSSVDFVVPPVGQQSSAAPATTRSSTIVSMLDGTLKVLRQGDIVVEEQVF